MAVMDQYEKGIREKVFRSDILTSGEWVYLVGLMHVAKEHDDLIKEVERLKKSLSFYTESGTMGLADENNRFRAALEKIIQQDRGEWAVSPGNIARAALYP